jgi:hypothetical protein
MAIGLHFTVKIISTRKVDNYLYIGQLNLDNHFLTVDQTSKDKIFFLGSSAVAGNNVPANTTLTDYFNQQNTHYQAYNLAALQANLLDANILLNLFKEKRPKVAILGIDPSILLENQSSLFSKYHSSGADLDLKKQIETSLHVTLKDKIELVLHTEPTSPTNFQVWWKSALINLRMNFWGPLFNKKLYGEERKILNSINSQENPTWGLIDTFIYTSRKNNIIPVIFIEPILTNTYPEKEFLVFQDRLKEKSELLNFSLLDYSSLFPPSHDFFYDFVHLTPAGYEKLASKLSEDLIKNNVIKGMVN